MEVFAIFPSLQSRSLTFSLGSTVQNLVDLCASEDGIPAADLYVKNNGRLSSTYDTLQNGAVYRLEPRLCGGKGGFGSMLRALGAQIEKTTNREACRDLSGRRLRDVNHEKEMAEWLKKQADREAEKEQRRADRLQRRLAEPKHYFSDPDYDQQCHDLSERLEDSVLKGMQAASSGVVQADEGSSRKRPATAAAAAAPAAPRPAKTKCLWTGMEDLGSSEEDSDDGDVDVSPSTSSSASCSSGGHGASAARGKMATATVTQVSQQEESCSSSSSGSSSPAPRRPPAEEEEEDQETHHMQAQAAAEQAQPEETPQGSTSSEAQAPQASVEMEKVDNSSSSNAQAAEAKPAGPVELSTVESVEQLEAMGLDYLKRELSDRGMKCGGTLQERAARLFAVRGMDPADIDPALLAKPSKKTAKKK